jgi:hypothetical protein
MKLCIAIIVGVVCLLLTSSPLVAQCGVERWAVKTGIDADAGLVNLNSTSATTISNLTSLARPGSLPDNNRIAPTERTVFVVNATLREFVRAYDSDYHMVLIDNAGRTMIAEIPSPNCVGANSPFAAGIARARAQFDAVFTPLTFLQTVNVPVQITGVGFFDYLEGQQGVAPNAIELHPIIDIQFGPFFMVSASPSSLAVPQGGSGSTTINSTLSGNFNSTVNLSVSGLPAGATAAIAPQAINTPGGGLATLTVSVPASTPLGTYNVVVTGSGAGQTHTATINLSVTIAGAAQQLLGNSGFENGASPSPWTATAGVIDNSNQLPAHSGSWKAWLNGFGTAHTDTLAQTVTIPSTATQALLSFWLHVETTEITTTQAFDTLRVQLRNTSGAVLKTLATYSNVNAVRGYQQFSFDVTSYKGQTLQIYFIGVEDSGAKTSFLVDDCAVYMTSGSGGGGGGGGTTTQMFGNPGFENGSSNPSPWTVTGGVVDNDPSEPPHSGSWKGWLNGWGVAHTDSAAQSVTIPANATGVTLSFWLHISTAETTKSTIYDSLAVQIRNSAGTVLATLANYSNLNAAPGYSQVTFDLTSYRGQTIKVYLLGVEDDGLKTSFLVDDFQVNVTTP